MEPETKLIESKKIVWQAREHGNHERSNDWFWVVGIVAVAGAILMIYFDNLLFALVILVGAFALMLQAHKKDDLITFEISRKGIRIDDKLFPYSMIESFWVIDEEVDDKILLKSKKPLMPLIIIPYDSDTTDPDEIRDYLLDYVHEDELHEPFHQKLMESIGL
jgi:hypothetical protein